MNADAYLYWIWDCPVCGTQNTVSSEQDWDECRHCGKTIDINCRNGGW